jgi:predicted RNase H-like HicB family nuclease
MKQFTAIIWKEENLYIAQCPQLDIASQGSSLEEAKNNLQEALSLWFECASDNEIKERLPAETAYITQVEVTYG